MLTALTLVSNTVLHRFPSPLHNVLCSSAVTVSLHSVVHTHSLLYATHWLAVIRLSSSCWGLVLYTTSVFLEYLTLTHSVFCKRLALCLFLEGTGIPSALTSKASLIATPLGALELCYSNFMCTLSENYSWQPHCTNHWKHQEVYT
jgi:hypothetical protein